MEVDPKSTTRRLNVTLPEAFVGEYSKRCSVLRRNAVFNELERVSSVYGTAAAKPTDSRRSASAWASRYASTRIAELSASLDIKWMLAKIDTHSIEISTNATTTSTSVKPVMDRRDL